MHFQFAHRRWLLSALLAIGGMAAMGWATHPTIAQDDQPAKTNPSEEPETDEAQDVEDEPDVVTPEKQISEIKSSMRKQIGVLKEQYDKTSDDGERESIVQQRRKAERESVQQALAIIALRDHAKKNVRDLVWFINRTKGQARTDAHGALVEKYLESEHMTELVRMLARSSGPAEDIEPWLKELIEKNPHEDVKGNATFGLAIYLMNIENALNTNSNSHPLIKKVLGSRSNEDLAAEIESLLNTCVNDYADASQGRQKIGQLASQLLIQMNLRVGNIAPDIVGVDLDNVEFKLSDYRGKVVVIDFWGDW